MDHRCVGSKNFHLSYRQTKVETTREKFFLSSFIEKLHNKIIAYIKFNQFIIKNKISILSIYSFSSPPNSTILEPSPPSTKIKIINFSPIN